MDKWIGVRGVCACDSYSSARGWSSTRSCSSARVLFLEEFEGGWGRTVRCEASTDLHLISPRRISARSLTPSSLQCAANQIRIRIRIRIRNAIRIRKVHIPPEEKLKCLLRNWKWLSCFLRRKRVVCAIDWAVVERGTFESGNWPRLAESYFDVRLSESESDAFIRQGCLPIQLSALTRINTFHTTYIFDFFKVLARQIAASLLLTNLYAIRD